MNVLSFSGGKDSTALLLMMLERKMHIDRIITIDTTKEFPDMYHHIEQVQQYIKPYNLSIEVIKIDFDYWFGEHRKTKGKNIGQVGYGWPDMRSRWCTSLKSESFQRCVYSDDTKYDPRKRGRGKRVNNAIEYHGIAYDEQKRTERNKDGRTIKYPLIDWGITEKEALNYCYTKGFTWGGLYEKMNRVSCYCCPMSRISELRILYNDFPDLWQEVVNMDKKSHRKFRADYSVEQLTDRFMNETLSNKTKQRHS